MGVCRAQNYSSEYRRVQIAPKDETDPTKRGVVRRLLDEEEVKLKDLTEHKASEKKAY